MYYKDVSHNYFHGSKCYAQEYPFVNKLFVTMRKDKVQYSGVLAKLTQRLVNKEINTTNEHKK
jgi:hypothetical protein